MRITSTLVALVALLVASVSPVAARAAVNPLTSLRITVAGTPVQGIDFAGVSEYDRTNISSSGGFAHTDAVDIAVGGGTRGRAFGLHVQAPRGQSLHVGTYYGDDVYGVRGLAWTDEGTSSCEYVQYTVKDIASSGTTITRLDVQFQSYCGGSISSVDGTLFGELSFGEPNTVANTATGTRSFLWPDIAVGADAGVRVPVWVRNTASSPVRIGQVTRSGAQSGDFRLASDGCTNHTLAGHSACQVQMIFHPTAGGRRAATVTVPVGGRSLVTALAGVGSPGTTLLRMTSQPGDYVGAGRSYLIRNTQEQMRVATLGAERFVGEVGDVGREPENWTVEITAPAGQVIKPGTHPTTPDGANSGWQFYVSGDGRGCGYASGTVTVKQASFNSDHAPTAFDATFVQTCWDPGTTGSLSGEIEYHAGT